MKLVTVAEMHSIEREADASGLSYKMMMENAGRGVAQEIMNAYSHYQKKSVAALIGSGNNGGDALVALDYLSRAGWKSYAYLVRNREEGDPLLTRLESEGGKIISYIDDHDLSQFQMMVKDAKVIIDGILGTGIQLPLKPELAEKMASYKNVISELREGSKIVAVDCPSGVDCDNGQIAPESISADMTITMAAVKTGLFTFPAAESIGELRVVSIGNLKNLTSWQSISREVITAEKVEKLLPKRHKNAHKGTFGTVLVVGGSINYTGAIILAGEAAYRVGAGLVTLAIPSTIYLTLAGQLPEATWILLPEELGVIASHGHKIILKNLEKADALLLGPGFGLEDTSREFLANLFDYHSNDTESELGFVKTPRKSDDKKVRYPPLVIDADGLKLISQLDEWFLHIPGESILTPHPGEMAILTGFEKDEIQKDRLGITQECAKKWGHVVILKGAYTVIAAPDGRMAVIPVATPALARAGTGDVLAGLIAGLRAQGLQSFEAAIAGAWIHAQAGIVAEKRIGNSASVLAGDVLDSIKDVISELNN